MNETETKYDAPDGAALPSPASLTGLPGVAEVRGPQEVLLEADYYDTDDLRLLGAGITLRLRRGGDDAGWHLKLPQGAGTRQEIRVPPGRAGTRVPRELSGLVRAQTRGQPLRPVARIATRRQLTVLLGAAGESLAEIAVDDVSAQTMGDSTTVSRWHEVEVELTGGDRRLLEAAGELLRREGMRPAGRSAKLERALGRRAGSGGEPVLSPATPAGQVVLAYLRAQAGELTSLDPMVRRDEPDSVHKMRVATRRLRSTLRSFRGVVDGAATAPAAGELKWLGGELGEARDAEVLAEHLLTELGQLPPELVIGPAQARVQGHFASARAAARTEVLAALDSQRYLSLLGELDRLLADPPFTPQADRPAAEVLPAAVRRTYRQARKRMRRAGHAAPGRQRDEALHSARKAAKRARYAGEAMTPAFGKKARRFAKRMKAVQSVLGEHQDTVIARTVERDLGIAAHLADENAFSFGLLYERDACRAGQLQERAQRAWRRASRPRYRRWMS